MAQRAAGEEASVGGGQAGRPGRVLGIDLGEVRIGLAVSDTLRRLALPHSVLTRQASPGDDHARIGALVEELGATLVVVGLPLRLRGGTGPAAERAKAEIEALGRVLTVPVVAVDERFSSREARQRAGLAGGTAREGRRRARRGRRPIDDGAAAVILQSYLDGAGPR